MPQLLFSKRAADQLAELRADAGQAKRLKAVLSALAKMENNLRHPGLNTHELKTLRCPHDDKLFEAYAQNNTPAAYRILFCYPPPPPKDAAFIVAIVPHL